MPQTRKNSDKLDASKAEPCARADSGSGSDATKIWRDTKPAVVQVHAQFVTSATDGSGIFPGQLGERLIHGNGFFVKGHYIVTAASLVLFDPATLIGQTRVSPLSSLPPFSIPSFGASSIPNELVRASRILVDVFDVNGSGKAYSYEATLVGVDGAGNIAILCIDPSLPYNFCQPKIKKEHPYLSWGQSRHYCPGSDMYIVGTPSNELASFPNGFFPGPFDQASSTFPGGLQQIVKGIVAANRALHTRGAYQGELLFADVHAGGFVAGAPFLDNKGRVIGMLTIGRSELLNDSFFLTNAGNGPFIFPGLNQSTYTAGPSEFFMRRVVKALTANQCQPRHCGETSDCHVAGVTDTPSYLSYQKGYAGVAWRLFLGSDYAVGFTGDFNSDILNIQPSSGIFAQGPPCKPVEGLFVVGVGGDTSGIIPGTSGAFPFPFGDTGALIFPSQPFTNSPFLGVISAGDQITHLDCYPVGDFGKQIAPGLVTWTKCPGQQLTITFKRRAENYERCYKATATLLPYPGFEDSPFPANVPDVTTPIPKISAF